MPGGTESRLGLVLAGLAFFISTASASGALEFANSSKANDLVTKTAISSKLRVVLAVGMEGTGHDYILQVNDHMFAAHELDTLEGYRFNTRNYHIQGALSKSIAQYGEADASVRENMHALAEREAAVTPPGTVFIIHGKYSYPDGNGPDKVLKYIDLRKLAAVAEEEGVDFRVVYLRRPIKGILIADTVHRNIQDKVQPTRTSTPEERFLEYIQVFLTDIAVMHSFLAELAPGFIVCHDYDKIGEAEQASKIAKFLAPNDEVAELLAASFVQVAKNPDSRVPEPWPYEGTELVALRLQSKLDSFENIICGQ